MALLYQVTSSAIQQAVSMLLFAIQASPDGTFNQRLSHFDWLGQC